MGSYLTHSHSQKSDQRGTQNQKKEQCSTWGKIHISPPTMIMPAIVSPSIPLPFSLSLGYMKPIFRLGIYHQHGAYLYTVVRSSKADCSVCSGSRTGRGVCVEHLPHGVRLRGTSAALPGLQSRNVRQRLTGAFITHEPLLRSVSLYQSLSPSLSPLHPVQLRGSITPSCAGTSYSFPHSLSTS